MKDILFSFRLKKQFVFSNPHYKNITYFAVNQIQEPAGLLPG